MNNHLSKEEKEKIFKLIIENPKKAFAIAQEIIDVGQVVSASTYASVKGQNKRTVQYRLNGMDGIQIEDRKFIPLVQT